MLSISDRGLIASPIFTKLFQWLIAKNESKIAENPPNEAKFRVLNQFSKNE